MWHAIQMRVLFCSIFLINTINLQGALLEVQINNISDDGVLHLAVYDSKEVFESASFQLNEYKKISIDLK